MQRRKRTERPAKFPLTLSVDDRVLALARAAVVGGEHDEGRGEGEVVELGAAREKRREYTEVEGEKVKDVLGSQVRASVRVQRGDPPDLS